MKRRAKFSPEGEDPGKPGVGRFGDRARHIEVKDRLGTAIMPFGKPAPAGLTRSLGPLPSDRLNGDAWLISGPVRDKVLEEGRPVVGQAVALEVGEWEGEGVVHADKGRDGLPKPSEQPFGDLLPSPMSGGASGIRAYFNGLSLEGRQIDPQAGQAGRAVCGAGIVDPDKAPPR